MEQLKQQTSKTLVLEKTSENSSEDFLIVSEEKKESAKKLLFENNTTEQYMENLKKSFSPQKKQEKNIIPKIQFEAAESFFSEQPKSKQKKQTPGQVSFSSFYNPQPETKIETQIKTVDLTEEEKLEKEPVIETVEEKLVEIEEKSDNLIQKTPKKRAKFKTRLKIFTFGCVAVLVCMVGWAIYNAVEIKTLTAEMEQANKIYSVNVVTHISNISKADDLTNPDSIFDLDALSDAGVIPLQPSPSSPVEFSVRSNWFDRLCNWLSNLFN